MKLRGFTLIELLVAMSLLAILAVLSVRGLVAVADGQQRIEAERRRWDAIAALFERLGDDIGQAWTRSEIGADDRRLPAWQATPAMSQISFLRAGPLQPGRSGWRLRDGSIEFLTGDREWLPVLDRVAKLEWRYLGNDGAWRSDWTNANILPRAVMISLELNDGVRLERRFATP